MEEYSYKDVIFDPTSEDVKNYIGKKVYFADNPKACLDAANNNNIELLGTLNNIYPCDAHPFYIDTIRYCHYSCIILKKEEPKEYVPFKDIDEFIAEYEKHTQKLKPYGFWIKQKVVNQTYRIESITGIFLDGVFLNKDNYLTSWSRILNYYVFEDNTPCGKLKE